MSFTQVLRELERVNERHQKIKSRYRCDSKSTNIYRDDLRADEAEDIRNFGYCSNDIIREFRRPETCQANKRRVRPETVSANTTKARTQTAKRPQSAVINFYKNEAYSLSSCLDVKVQPIRKFSTNSRFNVQKCKVKEFSFKNEFKRSFMTNLEDMGLVQSGSTALLKVPHQTKAVSLKSQTDNSNKRHLQSSQTVFALTAYQNQENRQQHAITLRQDAKELRRLAELIVQKSQLNTYYSRVTRGDKYRPIEELPKCVKLPESCTLFLIETKTMKSCLIEDVNPCQKTGLFLKQGESVGLGAAIQRWALEGLKGSGSEMLHVGIAAGNTLLWQQFVLQRPFSSSTTLGSWLLYYYCRHYLLLDESSSLGQVMFNAQMMLDSRIDVPSAMREYIAMLPEAMAFYSRKGTMKALQLQDQIKKAFKPVKTFTSTLASTIWGHKWKSKSPQTQLIAS